MPTLQVRDLPEHLYRLLKERARREYRSLAGQAVVELERTPIGSGECRRRPAYHAVVQLELFSPDRTALAEGWEAVERLDLERARRRTTSPTLQSGDSWPPTAPAALRPRRGSPAWLPCSRRSSFPAGIAPASTSTATSWAPRRPAGVEISTPPSRTGRLYSVRIPSCCAGTWTGWGERVRG